MKRLIPETNAEPKKYYFFLDGFRAFAVIWVMLLHIEDQFRPHALLGHFYPYFAKFCFPGFLAVDTFFVISGFLITGLLLDDFQKGPVRLRRFYTRRFFKIVPHYLFVLICGIALAFALNPDLFLKIYTGITGQIFFLQNYTGTIALFDHTWTLAVEEHFYLIYPILLAGIAKTGKDAAQRTKILVYALLGLLALSTFLKVKFLSGTDYILKPQIAQFTHLRYDSLLFGCLIRLFEPALDRISSGHPVLSGRNFFIGGMLLYGLLVGTAKQSLPAWIFFSCSYLAAGCWLIAGLKHFALILLPTENKLIRTIGRNSYGIYLWHFPVLPIFIKMAECTGVSTAIAAYILSSILLGVLTTQTVERFALNIRHQVMP